MGLRRLWDSLHRGRSERSIKDTGVFKITGVPSFVGFVCYVDVLGYAKSMKNQSFGNSIDHLVSLRNLIQQVALSVYQSEGLLTTEGDMAKYLLNPRDYTLGLPFWFHIASDSVLYWSNEYVSKLADMLGCVRLTLTILAEELKLLARGAVARGRVALNPEAGIYLGSPIAECVDLEKRMTAPGVIVPMSYLTKDDRLFLIRDVPNFVPCTYRLKKGASLRCLYLNWIFDYMVHKRVCTPEHLRQALEADGFHPSKVDQLMTLMDKNGDVFVLPVLDDQ